MTVIQRFGSALNLNVHFHTLMIDGVYELRLGGPPIFHPVPSPTDDEVAVIAGAVLRQVGKKLDQLDDEAEDAAVASEPLLASLARRLGLGCVDRERHVARRRAAVGQVRLAVVAAYDFSPFTKVVDVGGGNGALVAAILKTFPSLTGITFDLPASAARAKATLAAQGLAGRCEAMAGDFFEGIPAGGDVYALKAIVHDWDDERSIAILKNVRKAIRPDGRVLLMESVIDPKSGAGSPAKLFDINMLVMTGGRERTAEEFAELCRASGFELVRIVAANPMLSVVEGRAV